MRKQRVEQPERCIRTRGLRAAAEALIDCGLSASLDSIAHKAGCPKASLVRVFETKEALLGLALAHVCAGAVEAMRQEAAKAGGGSGGALAAALLGASVESGLCHKSCPINAAAAQLAWHPWAEPAIREHLRLEEALFEELLSSEIGAERAHSAALSICLVRSGLASSAGRGCEAARAAGEAIRAIFASMGKF